MERPKALVVDDAPIARMAATLTLQLMGYEVDEAASPATALDMFHPAKYALIIMDYQMPQMNGFQCTAKIRELETGAGSRTPILCMSMENEPNMKELCRAAGLDEFLNKECSTEEMHQVIRGLTAKRGVADKEN